MPKKKKKFHKIVIHPNRYLIWACVIMFIVAASLVAYIRIGNIVLDATQAPDMDVNFWHTYEDSNITLRYPGDWTIDPGPNYVGFGNKNSDMFVLYSYSPPNDPAYESYAMLPTSRHISIDGVMGIRVADTTNTSQRIAFVKTNKRLYEFRGDAAYFDEILNTIKLPKNK